MDWVTRCRLTRKLTRRCGAFDRQPEGLDCRVVPGADAKQLKTEPPNLTQLTRRAGGTFPDDNVRKRIDGRDLPAAHGSTEMPVWGYWFTLHETAAGLLQEDRETAEKEVKKRIARLVAYLKTLQK